MSFFNSLGTVISNKKNFKQWEKQNNDKTAQRQVLLNNKPLSDEELNKAKKQGKVLIDIVDIMDTHSEDVAENVESATAPIEAIAPFVGALGTGVASYFTLLKPNVNKYSEISEKFLEENKNKIKEIAEKATEQAKDGRKLYSSQVEEMVSFPIKSLRGLFKKASGVKISKETEQEINELAKNLDKVTGKYTKGIKIGIALIPIAFVASFIGSILFNTKLQVQSSRVARWQSREGLKDPKYFVQYTDEQIQQAEENLKNKEEEKSGIFSKLFSNEKKKKGESNSIIGVLKDNKEYKEWKKNDTNDSKKVTRELSEEELINAEKDQEVIQRITKEINNKAEDYSENMETAAETIFGATPILGFLFTKPIAWLTEKSGLGEWAGNKISNKLVSKMSDVEKNGINSIVDKIKNIKKGQPLAAKIKSIENITEDLSNLLNTGSKEQAKQGFAKLSDLTKKSLAVLSKTGGTRKAIITVVGTLATTIGGIILALKLQKSSARAGRFVAKRELASNPENFVGFTKEEYNEVKDIKAKEKTGKEKFVEYITFIPRVIKQYFEYSKFKKTEGKHQKELLEELTKLDVTDEQLKNAKNYQRKLFNTFECVDEGSQEYSEQMEAATAIAKPAIMYGSILTAVGIPLTALAIAAKKGKLKFSSILDTVTGFFAKHTKFLKGKTMSKYMDDVAQNMGVEVKKVNVENMGEELSKKLNSISKTIMLGEKNPQLNELLEKITHATTKADYEKLNKELGEFLSKDKKNLNDLMNLLQNLGVGNDTTKKLISETSIKEIIEILQKKIPASVQLGGISLNEIEIDAFIEQIMEQADENGILPEIATKTLKNIIAKMDETTLNDLLKKLSKNASKETSSKINPESMHIITEFIKANLKTFVKIKYENFIKQIDIKDPQSWRKVAGELLEKYNIPANILDNIGDDFTSEKVVHIIQNSSNMMKNIPTEEISKIAKISVELFKKDPVKFLALVSNPKSFSKILTTKGVKATLIGIPAAWGTLTFVGTYAVESYLAGLQKQAGRLGVMKGLEKLDDPRYYADEE